MGWEILMGEGSPTTSKIRNQRYWRVSPVGVTWERSMEYDFDDLERRASDFWNNRQIKQAIKICPSSDKKIRIGSNWKRGSAASAD